MMGKVFQRSFLHWTFLPGRVFLVKRDKDKEVVKKIQTPLTFRGLQSRTK